MAYSKTIPMHKRLASGEPVTGMKKGGRTGHYRDGGAAKAAPVRRTEAVARKGKVSQ